MLINLLSLKNNESYDDHSEKWYDFFGQLWMGKEAVAPTLPLHAWYAVHSAQERN